MSGSRRTSVGFVKRLSATLIVAGIAMLVATAPAASAHPTTLHATRSTHRATHSVAAALASAAQASGRSESKPLLSGPVAVISQGPAYSIPKPPKSVGNAVLRTAAETLQNVGNMIAGAGAAGLIANGLASLGLVTLPATVPGAAVSGVIFGAGLGISFIGGFIKNYATDPIDFDFTRLAKPRKVKLPRVKPAAPSLGKLTGDEHRLLEKSVGGYALSLAFQASVDRAHGALVKHNRHWEQRQLGAAVGYAHQAKPLLKAMPALQARVEGDIRSLGLSVVAGSDDVRRYHATLGAGLPKQLKGLLKQFGLTHYARFIDGTLRHGSVPSSYGLEFPALLTDPGLLSAESRAASALGRLNRSKVLALISSGHAG